MGESKAVIYYLFFVIKFKTFKVLYVETPLTLGILSPFGVDNFHLEIVELEQ